MDTPGGTFASEARFVVEEIRDVDGSRVAVIGFEAQGGVADPEDPETEVSRDDLGGEILFDIDRGLILRDRTEMIVEFTVEESEQPLRVESSSELLLVDGEEPSSDAGAR